MSLEQRSRRTRSGAVISLDQENLTAYKAARKRAKNYTKVETTQAEIISKLDRINTIIEAMAKKLGIEIE